MNNITIGYGIGRNYNRLKKKFAEMGISFDYLADSKWQDTKDLFIDDIPVISFEKLKELDGVEIIVLVDNPTVYKTVMESFPNAIVSHFNYFYLKWCYRKALSVIDKYSIQIPNKKGIHYFVFDSHLGDVMGLLPYVGLLRNFRNNPASYFADLSNRLRSIYCKKIDPVNRIIAITRKSNVGVCKLCPDIDEIIEVTNDELEALQMYACYERNLLYLYPDPHHSFPNHLDFHVVLREDYCLYSYWCYGLRNSEMSREYINNYEYKIPGNAKKKAEEFLVNRKLDPGKLAVICPRAQSTSELSDSFWLNVIDFLQNEGFYVMENTGPGEISSYSIDTVSESVDVMCALGEAGAVFTGVQSGLLDVFKRFPESIRTISIYAVETLYDVLVKKVVSGDNDKLIFRNQKYSVIFADDNSRTEYKIPDTSPNAIISLADEEQIIRQLKEEILWK